MLSHDTNYYSHDDQKSILKQYLRTDFDGQFVNRKKQGFVFNLEKFIYENIDQILETIKQNDSGLNLDLKALNYLKKYKSRMNAIRIWKLLFWKYIFFFITNFVNLNFQPLYIFLLSLFHKYYFLHFLISFRGFLYCNFL